MIIPPLIKEGDTIGVTCPCSKIDLKAAEYAIEAIKKRGFKVQVGKTVGTNFNNFSATDQERRDELQQMLDDDNINSVIFGRGGYGMIRIVDQLDFNHFIKNPKWLCGYSDITALHLHLQSQYHIAFIHSLMCSGITEETINNKYVESLFKTLTREHYQYDFAAHEFNRNGRCCGELIGGNLSLLATISGSRSQPGTKGKILFMEDVGEYRYNVDRMLYNLKRAGWLDELNGLLIGAFTEGKETETPFGQTEYEIIEDLVQEYDYPVAYGFPAGHQVENYALKLGVENVLMINKKCSLIC